MKTRLTVSTFATVAGLALALTGCQGKSTADFTPINEALADITKKQDDILKKLAELDGKVGAGARPQQQQRPAGPDPAATYKVTLDGAVTKGSDNAKVTIVEWSDFQCPFCSRVTPTMKELEKIYGDNLRIAFKHNPLSFHDKALPAALAAEAAGNQGKFWEMHDLLFGNQKELSPENFEKWAKELGLNVDQFKKDMADPAVKKKVESQQAQGMKLGARGTPAFFINGRFLSGAQPVDAFKTVIDEEMKKADAMIAGGTPAAKVYEATVAKGKDAV